MSKDRRSISVRLPGPLMDRLQDKATRLTMSKAKLVEHAVAQLLDRLDAVHPPGKQCARPDGYSDQELDQVEAWLVAGRHVHDPDGAIVRLLASAQDRREQLVVSDEVVTRFLDGWQPGHITWWRRSAASDTGIVREQMPEQHQDVLRRLDPGNR